MMKKLAILGAPCNNGNLGCMALTYSLLNLLEQISSSIDEKFIYYIYEGNPSELKTREVAKNLGISSERIKSFPLLNAKDPVRFALFFKRNLPILRSLRECNLAIDMTQGDSFTDIYGDIRFQVNTNIKLLIEKMGIPLILGPQTYGPYHSKKYQRKAGKAIKYSTAVIARDKMSAQLVKKIAGRDADISADLAFQLPYERCDRVDRKLRIGVNISGLLVKNKLESTTTDFLLCTDYDLFINRILKYLDENNYEIYLIPHVSEDFECIKAFHQEYPNAKILDMFKTPMEAKSAIAQMDFFIGARMHATIASVSSGVPTLPIAYSRKFKGVFDLIEYRHVIDLQKLDTDSAVSETIYALTHRNELKADVEHSMDQCNQYLDGIEQIFKNIIIKCV